MAYLPYVLTVNSRKRIDNGRVTVYNYDVADTEVIIMMQKLSFIGYSHVTIP